MAALFAARNGQEGGKADGDADAERADAQPGFEFGEMRGEDGEHVEPAADDSLDGVGGILVDDFLAAHARAVCQKPNQPTNTPPTTLATTVPPPPPPLMEE